MRQAARLRLATLEDLEANQESPSQSPHPNHQYQGRSRDRAEISPRHSHVSQILYAKDVQKDYPAWKRWVTNNLHIPLFRLFEKVLGLFPPSGKDEKGVYVWVSHQGCFKTESEAKRDAARYPHGYVVPNMPLGRSLTADVPAKSSIYFPAGNGNGNGNGKHPETVLAPVFDELRKLDSALKAATVI